MTDSRDTGEHFLGPIPDQPDLRSQMSARRVADLTTQIEFLDSEIIRYRELLEHERIRHATQTADLQLDADTRIDEVRRVERMQATDLHNSYRALLSERQVQFEESLSEAAAKSATQLADEQRRRYEVLERERTRHHALLEATRRQTLDDALQSYQDERQALTSELAQANTAIERLQEQLDTHIVRADQAEARTAAIEIELAAVERDVDRSNASAQARIDEAERQVAAATDRLETERRRSAATLAELLGRSASIAAEADKARSQFVAQQAQADGAAAAAQQRLQDEYKALAEAADERSRQAIERESELEAAIADLRNQLPTSHH